VVHVGSAGIGPPILDALEAALTDHELVKVRLHEPEDKKGLARALADQSGAALCGLVGHTAILYRAHPESPRIELPVRG
jgi:RNA-binding protein